MLQSVCKSETEGQQKGDSTYCLLGIIPMMDKASTDLLPDDFQSRLLTLYRLCEATFSGTVLQRSLAMLEFRSSPN